MLSCCGLKVGTSTIWTRSSSKFEFAARAISGVLALWFNILVAGS